MGNKPSRSKIADAAFEAKLQAVREEYAGELEELRAIYVADYAPDTDDQRILVEALAYCEWQQRCLDKVEAQVWNEEIGKAESWPYPLGEDDLRRMKQSLDDARSEYHQTLGRWDLLCEARKAARKPVKPAFNLAEMPNASRWRM
jgi:hypothetical protein